MVLIERINVAKIELIRIVTQASAKSQVITTADMRTFIVVAGAERNDLVVPILRTRGPHEGMRRAVVPCGDKRFRERIRDKRNRVAVDHELCDIGCEREFVK